MPKSLVTLLEHAERQRDEALVQQQRADEVLTAALAQYTQLNAYRQEHQRRWSAEFQQPVSVSLLHCHHAFSDRLHDAVTMQNAQVERARQVLLHRQAATLEAERRVAAIGKLIERRVAVIRSQQQRQEQRQTDEQVSRAAWTRTQEPALNGW